MKLLRAARAALGFLTRLPSGTPRALAPEELGRALYFFPLVGALLGGLLWSLERVLHARCSAELLAVLLTAVLAALTGGLHLDGLADVVDGLAGGRGDRARALEIMRDSRIGALGALALVLVLLVKVVAVRDVLLAGGSLVLLAFPLAARACVVPLIVYWPYARARGLGSAFHDHGRHAHVAIAVSCAAGAGYALGVRATIASLASLAVSVAVAGWWRQRLGGLTGDCYGAAIELAELTFLATCALR